MDEETYKKGLLGEIEKRLENELDHVHAPTRQHIMKIVDEVARTYVPVGNMPVAPIHDDYYCEMKPQLSNETLSILVSKDRTFAWEGDC